MKRVSYNLVQGDFPLVRKGGSKREQGKILFNRYIILNTLYETKNSKVYLSKHISLNDIRVIKKLFKNLLCEENFHSEASVLKSLKHDGIPIIYDIEEDDEAYYIIEEYIKGENLYDYVKEKGTLSEDVAINFGIQISEIISYLHKQKPKPILYLDLKPQNIIIDNSRVFLVDFGNSMFADSTRRYMSGTKGFAAPEQYTFKDIDSSTDVYGIGALLYFMVTGTICEDSNEAMFDTNILVSQNFKNIIIQCMAPKDKRTKEAFLVARNLNEIIHEKLRKNEKKNLLEKPLIISVFGTEKHIGVTHFSLALTGRLNQLGIKSVYQDESGNIIKSYYERYDDCGLYQGIYSYKEVIMAYSYSDMISLPKSINCKVVDCSGKLISDEYLDDFDVVVLIAGGKPWEIQNSLEVIKEFYSVDCARKKFVFWNYDENNEKICIPIFVNPFERKEDINIFLDKVINMIFEEENVYKKENKKRFFRFFTRKK